MTIKIDWKEIHVKTVEEIIEEYERQKSTVISANSRIVLMKQTNSWAEGYHALQDACKNRARKGRTVVHSSYSLDDKTSYRPLTLGENLRARIADAQAHGNVVADSLSWSRWNDSCTAIVYGPNGRFKVQKISPDLLRLKRNFNEPFVQVDYDRIQGTDVREFDRKDAKYGQYLTQDEALRHPFWLFVADNDAATLCDYAQLQWSRKSPDYKAMAIRFRDQPGCGELRALCVYDHNNDSSAGGVNFLGNGGSFLQVSSRSPIAAQPLAPAGAKTYRNHVNRAKRAQQILILF